MKINIRFVVEKIIRRNDKDGYTVAKIKLLNYPSDIEIPTVEPVMIGYFITIHVGDEFQASGEWVNHQDYGWQFKIYKSTLLYPESNKAMVEFLRKYVKGIGRITAKKVVEEFGQETYSTILYNPERLIEIGITEKKTNAMNMAITEHKAYEELVGFLSPLGMRLTEITLIYKKMGGLAKEKIRDNPYVLCKYKNDIGFKVIDELAKKLDFEANNSTRIKYAIIMYISKQIEYKGDMFVLRKDIYNNLADFLNKHGAYEEIRLEKEKIDEQTEKLTLEGKLVVEENNDGKECIYLSFYSHIEDIIAKKMIKKLGEKHAIVFEKSDIDDSIRKYEMKTAIKLDSKQRNAVCMAINSNISILSGGPGTGKTQTINAIISCIRYLNPNSTVELCAPTGRAAKRMTELTGMEAKTIHRLIGLDYFKQGNTELIEIDTDYLIIDEASMVDAYMFYSILSAISTATKVLIVGDHEQLPSVGAGLVLRDIIDSGLISTTILTRIFRQDKGSQIIINSHRIIKGNNQISLNKDLGDFYFINNPNKHEIQELILLSIYRLLETGFALDDIQVISFLNNGDLGVDELNSRIQDRFNPRQPNILEKQVSNNRSFRLKDRVMQTVNNYELDVFNGEVGTIINIKTNPTELDEITVDYGDKYVIYDESNISQLTLGYAVTVHKSQGTEFPVIIVPFHSSLNYMINRSTVYTGWTRAKRRVICIGDIDELDSGIKKIDNTIRNSRIIEKMHIEYQQITME